MHYNEKIWPNVNKTSNFFKWLQNYNFCKIIFKIPLSSLRLIQCSKIKWLTWVLAVAFWILCYFQFALILYKSLSLSPSNLLLTIYSNQHTWFRSVYSSSNSYNNWILNVLFSTLKNWRMNKAADEKLRISADDVWFSVCIVMLTPFYLPVTNTHFL